MLPHTRSARDLAVAVLVAIMLTVLPADAHGPAPQGMAPPPLPIGAGGPFALIDHHGRPVTDADFHGRFMLVFFGYANCQGVCPSGLRSMTTALDLLGADSDRVTPVLITVDPEADTPETMATAVNAIHPKLVGLTGSLAALSAAGKAYKVSAKLIGWTVDKKPIIEHGSFIYLMGPDGAFVALYPPILDPEAIARSVRQYL